MTLFIPEKKQNHRLKKISSALHSCVCDFFMRHDFYKTDSLTLEQNITVTKTNLSPDLSKVDIYVTPLANKNDDVLSFLKNSSKELRFYLAKKLNLRKTPQPFFYIDHTIHAGDRIDELLLKMNQEK